MLHLSDFGAVMNDPSQGIVNFAALQAAFAAAALLQWQVIELDDGELYVDIPGDLTGVLIPSDAYLVLRGADRATSRIVASDAIGDTALFTVASGGGLALRDMTLVGPADGNGYITRAVQHLGDGQLILTDVATENYSASVYRMSGAGDLVLEDCAFTGTGVGPTTFQIGAQNISRARIRRCDFRGFGVTGSDQAHAIYCYRGVDLEVDSCSFDGQYGTGYAIQCYGGVGVSPNVSVHDCEFGAGVYQGVLTNPTVRTRIADCRFLSLASGVVAQYDTDIDDCEFTVSAPLASPISMAGSQAMTVRASDTRFDLPASGVYCVSVGVTGSRAILSACYGTCNAPYAASAVAGATYETLLCEWLDEVGHLTLKSKQPTPSLGMIAANVANAGVAGNDMRGYITFDTTATIPAGTALCTFAPNKQYSAAPYVQVTNHTADKAAVAFGVSAVGYAGFVLRNLAQLPVAQAIHVSYLIVS